MQNNSSCDFLEFCANTIFTVFLNNTQYGLFLHKQQSLKHHSSKNVHYITNFNVNK